MTNAFAQIGWKMLRALSDPLWCPCGFQAMMRVRRNTTGMSQFSSHASNDPYVNHLWSNKVINLRISIIKSLSPPRSTSNHDKCSSTSPLAGVTTVCSGWVREDDVIGFRGG